jgi:hypothetical protein
MTWTRIGFGTGKVAFALCLNSDGKAYLELEGEDDFHFTDEMSALEMIEALSEVVQKARASVAVEARNEAASNG